MDARFGEFLDDISRCFLDRDLDLWLSRLVLPFSMVTRNAHVNLNSPVDAAQNFQLYLRAADLMALDIVDRSAQSLEDCNDGTWLGTFQTRLISRGQLCAAPYTSVALLRLEDGRLRMSSLLNARCHSEAFSVHAPQM